MPRVRNMQGTPAHIETLKNKDGVRRHPAHCIFAVGKGKNRICDCDQSPIWNSNCRSAKQCDYYSEK